MDVPFQFFIGRAVNCADKMLDTKEGKQQQHRIDEKSFPASARPADFPFAG
jgi:hypothetical protein